MTGECKSPLALQDRQHIMTIAAFCQEQVDNPKAHLLTQPQFPLLLLAGDPSTGPWGPHTCGMWPVPRVSLLLETGSAAVTQPLPAAITVLSGARK